MASLPVYPNMGRLWLLTTLLTVSAMAPADTLNRPVVLELFTSEGCSSCPPAELLVNELAQRPDVLALSFHVDYWDGLGWKDRFSFAGATQRQRGYAQSLRHASVYTPQALVDGTRDVVATHRSELVAAVGGSRVGVDINLHQEAGTLRVHVGASPAGSSGDVVLVGYLRSATTHIGRGENGGRTLLESNVVRSLKVLGHWNGTARDFDVDAGSVPDDATDVAVLLQTSGQGSILGAMTQRLR